MEEWTDEFIRHAQHELVAMVKDWQYDYGPSDEECAAMLMWMLLRLKPDINIGADWMKDLSAEAFTAKRGIKTKNAR